MTVRDRDTLAQERIAIDELAGELARRLAAPWRTPKAGLSRRQSQRGGSGTAPAPAAREPPAAATRGGLADAGLSALGGRDRPVGGRRCRGGALGGRGSCGGLAHADSRRARRVSPSGARARISAGRRRRARGRRRQQADGGAAAPAHRPSGSRLRDAPARPAARGLDGRRRRRRGRGSRWTTESAVGSAGSPSERDRARSRRGPGLGARVRPARRTAAGSLRRWSPTSSTAWPPRRRVRGPR